MTVLKRSIITAANQSKLEATRDQREAREKSCKPLMSGIDSARLIGWRENSYVTGLCEPVICCKCENLSPRLFKMHKRLVSVFIRKEREKLRYLERKRKVRKDWSTSRSLNKLGRNWLQTVKIRECFSSQIFQTEFNCKTVSLCIKKNWKTRRRPANRKGTTCYRVTHKGNCFTVFNKTIMW